MLMFGKPGAGKGTLSKRLVQKYDVSFVPCGDILRQNIHDKTDVGKLAEKIMEAGDLVPDEIMARVVTQKLDSLKNKHWILDGFPRTQAQGKMLDVHLEGTGYPLSLVVILDVPDDVILDRISNRWIHQPSGRVYNTSYNAPKREGLDDETGEPLTKRPDDNPHVFSKRLSNYYKSTDPLISYFTSRQNSNLRVASLTGKTSDEIWPKLVSTVEKWFPLEQRSN